jgi:hypothetical protein
VALPHPPRPLHLISLFAGYAAAHHNSGIGNVKCTLWCKNVSPEPVRPGSGAAFTGSQRRQPATGGMSELTPQKKTPPNKKRPKLSRVIGRPNSPPPGLLTKNDTVRVQKCIFHLRANPWHEQAISRLRTVPPTHRRVARSQSLEARSSDLPHPVSLAGYRRNRPYRVRR